MQKIKENIQRNIFKRIKSSIVLQQVKSKVENTKAQISSVQGAISALKNWEVEFNQYLGSLDAQMTKIQRDTESIRIKEESLEQELNSEKMRQTEIEQENMRETQVRRFISHS